MTMLTFNEVKNEISLLADKIIADGFEPDFIVGLARGGWIPARLLSDKLRVKYLLSFGVAYADGNRENLIVYSEPNPFPSGRRVLLVEDCLESGKSLEFAAKYFERDNQVGTASLFLTEKTIFPARYFNRVFPAPPHFPWEE